MTNRASSYQWAEYYVVFCPRHRRPVLVGDVAESLEELIDMTSYNLGCEIKELIVLPKEVHVHVVAPTDLSAAAYVSKVKRESWPVLKKLFPDLVHRLGVLWTRDYFATTIGSLDMRSLRMFLEDKKRTGGKMV